MTRIIREGGLPLPIFMLRLPIFGAGGIDKIRVISSAWLAKPGGLSAAEIKIGQPAMEMTTSKTRNFALTMAVPQEKALRQKSRRTPDGTSPFVRVIIIFLAHPKKPWQGEKGLNAPLPAETANELNRPDAWGVLCLRAVPEKRMDTALKRENISPGEIHISFSKARSVLTSVLCRFIRNNKHRPYEAVERMRFAADFLYMGQRPPFIYSF
jgi:hypothetical protein